MRAVNMFEAKSNLSRLVESGAEAEVVIARNGCPAARLVPINPIQSGQRIGIAKDKLAVPDATDTHEAAITA